MALPGNFHMAGRTVGRYQLERLLYHGGHGPLYRATANGATYAVKLPFGGGSPAEIVPLLVVQHPRIAKVIEAGETDGQPWIAGEWLEGHFLNDELSFNPLTPERALSITEAICEALAALHAAGQVHGNLKTTNVFVGQPESPAAPAGELKILDPSLPGWDEKKTDDLAGVKAILKEMLEGQWPEWTKGIELAETATQLAQACRAAPIPAEERMRQPVRPPQPEPPPFTPPFPTNWSPPPPRPQFAYTPAPPPRPIITNPAPPPNLSQPEERSLLIPIAIAVTVIVIILWVLFR